MALESIPNSEISSDHLMHSFPVVGIGASAGGLEAMSELLSHFSPDNGFAYLIVQHLGPGHASLLAEILAKKTTMPVTEAREGETVERNHVYVIPPNTSMTVASGRLALKPRNKLGSPMPIDDLFESLAEDYGPNAIGIVLSGTGSDGAIGMQIVKGEGGITFAQDDATAKFNGMPHSAIKLGCVDFVLSPSEIANELARIGHHPYLAAARPTVAHEPLPPDEDSMKRIFRRLRNVCRVDFTHYKPATVKRRITRRLALHKLDTLADYANFLEATPTEPKNLCQDLLIRVTSFFRDPETFNELRNTLLPLLLKDRDARTPLRIWVPGCASGEEVYSIAICVLECLGERANNMHIQIFGTDASEDAISTARAGNYIENIARDVSEERLRRFFTKTGAYYQISKSIRDLCIFSRHDLTRDPPFSHIDLVSCRNVLIYLNAELQKRVIPSFHYALRPGGMLILGASETIGSFSELFNLIDNKKLKIYTKKQTAGRAPLEVPDEYAIRYPVTRRAPEEEVAEPKVMSDLGRLHAEADRLALSHYVPAGVLCDEDLNILQFRGDTAPYLSHPPGTPNLNLNTLVRPELLAEVGSATRQARNTNAPVRQTGLRIETRDGARKVNLEVIPIGTMAGGYSFLIFFEEPSAPTAANRRATIFATLSQLFPKGWRGAKPRAEKDAEILQLAKELEASRAYTRTIIEEHASADEELKSAQEELLSSNEEFQSTNEELETAKEELQSTNEELATTNDELRHRNQELHKLNEDLEHARDYADAIVETVRVPLVVLDPGLRVLRANRAFYACFDTTPAETERRLIYDLGDHQWASPELRRLLEGTLPKDNESDDYEMTRVFPKIGERTMCLHARRLGWTDHALILLAIEDVTVRQRAIETMQEDQRLKDEFLAMLAHELRNPLATIRSALEVWKRGAASPEKQKQAQAMLERQLQKEIRLVDDLLDVSRITRGLITLTTCTIDLVRVVHEAVEETQYLLQERHHELDLALPAEPVLVEGDATRLEQVVANLLSNSIKFTAPGGHITISLERRGTDALLKVADNGIGITKAMQSAVFDLFVQADRSLDRNHAGLGLGLTLARRLVELHNGEISVTSAGLGHGSEFLIRLPLSVGATAPAELKPAPDPVCAPYRILVVDDNVDAAESLAALLELSGHSVAIAHDGNAALEATRTFNPQVILLDIGLPGLDGYEVAKRLREMPGTDQILLLALSGFGQTSDRKRSKEARFDDHLVKPVDLQLLQRLFAEHQSR